MKTLTFLAATLSLSGLAPAQATPVQWSPLSGGNDHWYELVTDAPTSIWSTAVGFAAARSYLGMSGYLATVNSASEQQFLQTVLNPSHVIVWLGGSDAATEGVWQWVTEPGGPITFWAAGTTVTYANWVTGEPNDLGGVEDGLHAWYGNGQANGGWNDVLDGFGAYAYIVEYSPSAVPVPAALPMLGAGVAALVALRRRKKA